MSNQYEREKNFFVFYVNHVMKPRPGPEPGPIETLDGFEKESMTKARKGLSLAINDFLEDTESWPIDAVHMFDKVLQENGAATLTELRLKHSKKYKKILRKAAIQSEVEYYLIKGIVDGMQEHVPENELPLLDAMLVEYENKSVGAP